MVATRRAPRRSAWREGGAGGGSGEPKDVEPVRSLTVEVVGKVIEWFRLAACGRERGAGLAPLKRLASADSPVGQKKAKASQKPA